MGYIGAGISRFNTADELTVTGDATIDTTTLVVDSTNNRVGVGTASPATALDVTGVITTDGMTTSADINFGDNDKAVFGAGSDLQISHTGSYSQIVDSGTGGLFIGGSSQIGLMNAALNEYMVNAVENGAVTLYHDNSAKLATTSTGVDVTGTAVVDGLTCSGTTTIEGTSTFGTSSADTRFNFDGPNQYRAVFKSSGTIGGQIGAAGADDLRFSNAAGSTVASIKDGNLLVGKTADNVATVGIEARATGPLISTRDGSDALRLNRLNSDGEIIQLRKDGTVIGSIGTQNWGIGTSSPSFGTTSSAGLEISHATRGIIRLEGNSAAQALELYGDSTGGTIDARGSGAALQFDLGGSEKARFDSSGRLLISTTSLINNDGAYLQSNGGSNLAFGFNVNYDGTLGRFYRSSSIVGSISVTTSATTYNTSSDRRLKSNIQDAASASDKIDAIQVRQFDWNADDSHQDYGLIAQELQPIEPMAVTGDADSDEMMGVDYSKLVPMLIKEIQELRSRVAALEAS